MSFLGTVAGTGGTLDRFFHRLDDDRLVDHLFGRDAVGDGEQLGPVGGYGGGHLVYPSVSISCQEEDARLAESGNHDNNIMRPLHSRIAVLRGSDVTG
jgi:hypothetical protein